MSTPVRMPKLGWTMEEGTVLQWYKKEGESITEGQPLLEVETDKVNIDVEAPATGILRGIKVGPDQTVAVETVIAVIAGPDEGPEESESPGQAAAEQAVATATPPSGTASGQQMEAAPPSRGAVRPENWKGPCLTGSPPPGPGTGPRSGRSQREWTWGCRLPGGCATPPQGEVGWARWGGSREEDCPLTAAQDHWPAHAAEFSDSSPLHGNR